MSKINIYKILKHTSTKTGFTKMRGLKFVEFDKKGGEKMSLTAGAIAGATAAGIGSLLGSAVNARNADISANTSLSTAPVSNSISGNLGVAQTNSVSSGSAWSEGYVAGKEASQADILRAAEANIAQREMMQMQMDYNSAEARLAREWSERMSNTAYQRAVADLKAAGLSPILAAGNLGASTPGASYASSALGTAQKANTYPEQYSKSESKQSGSSSGKQMSIGGSKSDSGPAYLKASGSVAQALANTLNVSSSQSLYNQATLAGMGVG